MGEGELDNFVKGKRWLISEKAFSFLSGYEKTLFFPFKFFGVTTYTLKVLKDTVL